MSDPFTPKPDPVHAATLIPAQRTSCPTWCTSDHAGEQPGELSHWIDGDVILINGAEPLLHLDLNMAEQDGAVVAAIELHTADGSVGMLSLAEAMRLSLALNDLIVKAAQ